MNLIASLGRWIHHVFHITLCSALSEYGGSTSHRDDQTLRFFAVITWRLVRSSAGVFLRDQPPISTLLSDSLAIASESFSTIPVTVDSSRVGEPEYGVMRWPKERRMLDARNDDRPAPAEQLRGTLWHCTRCDAFVSIHCVRLPRDPLCPTCFNAELEFCGGFESLLARQFADA